jgi:hypothetical protein
MNDQGSAVQSPQDDASSSPLLRLAGEIRNKIYQLPLKEEGAVQVTPSGITEPGLLLVNRQIRQEAMPIFYTENKVEILTPDYDPTTSLLWKKKTDELRRRFGKQKLMFTSTVEFQGQVTANWSNLIRWLKHFHAGRLSSYILCPSEAKGG